ncbi:MULTISPECIES: alpha/beta fold hydrolase [Halorubrum]|jgi:pimeloyl-ACP methyl ester carboxylesterase|uniref:Carboxylesterase n=1 Tax=Halorubrum tropicale TaxID=1765655 RepID=A0A0M9AU47_9EURY|nr:MULTISPECIES: alpha/beta hydrolase [Halorubrum]KOX97865.1 carboxylesterase [Halorubrum tropicale]RLM50408.1 alpha/beta fold hydrolase [Halorubrum sp. Atlit-28R]
MERVTHDGRETAYRRFDRGGDGPTVCLVHGSGGTKDVWKSQARLADRFPAVAVDLSGHGDSGDATASAGREALEAYADDVVAVAEATDATVLCGNSLGGAVALWVALERDLALDGLVLAGTGAKLAVAEPLRDALADDFERAVSLLHEPDRLFHDAPAEYVELSEAAMRACGRAVTERDFLTCHRFDVRDRLGEVAVPALAVVGAHDGLTPPAYHEYLAAEIPEGERTEIPDAAHLAMLERPTAFNDALAEFLGRL